MAKMYIFCACQLLSRGGGTGAEVYQAGPCFPNRNQADIFQSGHLVCRCAPAPAAAPLPAPTPIPPPEPVCATVSNPASGTGHINSCSAQGSSRGAAVIPGKSAAGTSCTDLQQAQQMLQTALSPALGGQKIVVQVI